MSRIEVIGSFEGIPEYLALGPKPRISVCTARNECSGNHTVYEIDHGELKKIETPLDDRHMVWLESRGTFVDLHLKDGMCQLRNEKQEQLFEAPLPHLTFPTKPYQLCRGMTVLGENPLRVAALLFSCTPLGMWGVLHEHLLSLVEVQDGECKVIQEFRWTNDGANPANYISAVNGLLYSFGIRSALILCFPEGAEVFEVSNGLPPKSGAVMQCCGPLYIDGQTEMACIRQTVEEGNRLCFCLYILEDETLWRQIDTFEISLQDGGAEIIFGGQAEPERLPLSPENSRPSLSCFYVAGELYLALYDKKAHSSVFARLVRE